MCRCGFPARAHTFTSSSTIWPCSIWPRRSSRRRTTPRSQNLMGKNHFMLGNYELAIKFFDKAIDLDANFYNAFVNRATTYYRDNQLQKAMQGCERSLPDAAAQRLARPWSVAAQGCHRAGIRVPATRQHQPANQLSASSGHCWRRSGGVEGCRSTGASGVPVTVFEKMPSPARKFLMAGRGGLNLTHSEPLEPFLGRYGEAAGWLRDAIGMLTPARPARIGLPCWGSPPLKVLPAGCFPKASRPRRCCVHGCGGSTNSGVRLETRKTWTGWTKMTRLSFADGTTFKPAVTVLALGGASWPRLGADGSWVGLLRDRGIQVNDLRASNAGIRLPGLNTPLSALPEQPLKRIALSVGGKTVAGEAMVSQSGLEGGAVYALSRCLREAADAAEGNPF
jgi:hypothetical protein